MVGQGNGCLLLDSSAGTGQAGLSVKPPREPVAQPALGAGPALSGPSSALGQSLSFWLPSSFRLDRQSSSEAGRCWGRPGSHGPVQETEPAGDPPCRELLGQRVQGQNPPPPRCVLPACGPDLVLWGLRTVRGLNGAFSCDSRATSRSVSVLDACGGLCVGHPKAKLLGSSQHMQRQQLAQASCEPPAGGLPLPVSRSALLTLPATRPERDWTQEQAHLLQA